MSIIDLDADYTPVKVPSVDERLITLEQHSASIKNDLKDIKYTQLLMMDSLKQITQQLSLLLKSQDLVIEDMARLKSNKN